MLTCQICRLLLRQLKNRRDNCIEKIQEFKAKADGIGGSELGNASFDASEFFTGLVAMSEEKSKHFCSFFHNSQES